MKILLTAINAKFIHTNLAIRYLQKYITKSESQYNLTLKEFTINNSKEYILTEIYKEAPHILCFSCYIWNIDLVLEITKEIKKIRPEVRVILGGPEVSFNTRELMIRNDDIDMVVIGEGEKAFSELIECLSNDEDFTNISNIAYRIKGEVYTSESLCDSVDMGDLEFPYDLEQLPDDKIIYYESSRGCPYNCQYCLSSSTTGVRFLPIERIKKELKYFLEQEVKQIKFIDRTFNANKKHALEILNYIKENDNGVTNFHFEISADILDQELLDVLENAPHGLIQFEIGVQTTNIKTLSIIKRNMNFEKLKSNVECIKKFKNIHQHLDLIVGLPEEDYFSFRQSFDDVISLYPDKLQVGFLKLLKGSGLRNEAQKHGYVYHEKSPYEVLETNVLTYGELIKLKGIEEMVDIYYNSGNFKTTISVILQNFYSSPFRFFEELYTFWEKEGLNHISHSKNKYYEILFNFYQQKEFPKNQLILECLKFDYIKNNRNPNLPSLFNRKIESDFKNNCHQFLKDSNNIFQYLPKYIDVAPKNIIKRVHFESFIINIEQLIEKPDKFMDINEEKTVILFDYNVSKRALENAKYYSISYDLFM
ncbi:B12-binding domain-containing radical SAM protein [Serpentinicella sp. ANB-PHB4]|uniref:B12-binding domain-containing radical SAM protein n=1 Tax=Serpentinicella sp. ANB-PHB4 TaxID=3074076 RepID=UPI00285D7347|nr:B12-binding domain-containing radical SAM protein [Serpentinicella sp. ANB-PHB4]MDR5659619.1 B12-binding domain-containing radical SAM protein [Serpentinicella sp. ANB-PHB4]